MNKKLDIKEGVNILLKEADLTSENWEYKPILKDDFTEKLIYKNKEIPILTGRYHGKLRGMKGIINDKLLGKLSSLKTYSFAPKYINLKSLIYKEIDLAQWLLNSKVEYVMSFIKNDKVANIISKMKNGTVCTLELATTLPINSRPQFKHELYSTHGILSDRVVDTQVAQDSIYLFNNEEKVIRYNDIDFNLYGLSESEIDLVYAIYNILSGLQSSNYLIELNNELEDIVNKCYQSSYTGEKEIIKGDKQ